MLVDDGKGITKVIPVYPEEDMDVWTKCHSNASITC